VNLASARSLRALALATALGAASVAAGCSAEESTASRSDDVRPVERVVLRAPRPYAPDRDLDARKSELDGSQKARREAAWKAVGKILANARADDDVRVDGRRVVVPAFRTWYNKDDVERIFARLYEQHGKEARRERKAPTAASIDAVMKWNADDRGSWADDAFAERLSQIDGQAAAQGLGGNARVAYSTGAIKHMLKNWAPLTRCVRGEVPDDPDAEPVSPKNFATCLDAEPPKDAAVIKTAWLRSDFGMQVPVRPTSAEALRRRVEGRDDEGGWGPGVDVIPAEGSIYAVKMSNGSSFRLPALHLVTKELREWLWISLWWSPEPDTDFGADRPPEIAALAGPWKNYKMCVVTGYEEHDPDPTGGFPTGPGSLGDALAATWGGVGKPTWCSNQYVERGAHNAQTNCIGCHQHAGTGISSEAVLADARAFPAAGRVKVRKNFPADYVFAATQPPEGIGSVFQIQVEHYDTIDR